MNFWKNKAFYHRLFQIGILLLPVVEIYRSFWGDTLQIFGFAAEELLLMAWAGICFLAGIAFSFSEKRKKILTFVGGYLALFLVYLVLHAWNASQFDASILPGANPNFVVECYYTARMYLFPICLIFAALLLSVPFEKTLRALKGAAWVISLSIVLTDLIGVSFISYANGNVVVDGGFFKWFTLPENADFARFTAKGPFSSANDVGAVLFILTAFVAFDSVRRGKWHDFLLLALCGISAVMVGTKIGALGFGLAVGAVLAVASFQRLFKREDVKSWKPILITACVFFIYIPLLLISPGQKLQNQRDAEAENADRPTESMEEIEDVTQVGDDEGHEFSEDELQKLEAYVEEYHWNHFIDPWFIEIYPVRYDPEYWSIIINRNNWTNSDTRHFKTDLALRIQKQNDRPLDKILGYGYTSGIPYSERDYTHQYFTFGGAGIAVLFLPFFALFAIGAVDLVKGLIRKKALLAKSIAPIALFAAFATAYLAGHVFDTLFTTYFMALSAAALGCNRINHES